MANDKTLGLSARNIEKDRQTGRFVGSNGLTENQSQFVEAHVANGGHAQKAAETAGYANPHVEGWRLMNLPHVRAAIWERRDRLIKTDLGSLGVKTISDLMLSEDTPAHVRFQAARFAVEIAGHGVPKESAYSLSDKPAGEMSLDELHQVIRKGHEAIASMKIVEVKAEVSA